MTGPILVARVRAHRLPVDNGRPAHPGPARRRAGARAVRTVPLAALPRLPFTSGSFDAAVANFVINHVGDPRAAVDELRRVVRPAGWIAVTIWPDPPPG
ncbi:methyltransferase domain-containing protein [Micromonospora chokoriensis]